ncbi:hypothetical protein DID78_01935 [Candidatus Marinamargulisbacteria bacterium SCGC AG-343-D04]|nr:hypothetical protein DID78_01935 [Candidatus Marinamargulisbacteria bacterium SCGC AG-343-D04]
MKNILVGICALMLSVSLMASDNLLSGKLELPFVGTGLEYKRVFQNHVVGAGYTFFDGEIGSETIKLSNLGVGYYIFTGGTAFKGFYYGPAVSYRTFDYTQNGFLGVTTLDASLNLIDVHVKFGYSFLFSDIVNLTFGGSLGFGVGEFDYNVGDESLIDMDPTGLTYSIESSLGFVF